MSNQNVLSVNDNFPIRTEKAVHSGKVRSVYWLTREDSNRLIRQHHYPVRDDAELAVMIISDRISAFDCIWHGENQLQGVPAKGAALNAIANHWFAQFRAQGLADNHILDIPHPLVWIVQKARPLKIEAIARRYITGSLWRAYAKGERHFCGIELPEGLSAHQRLPELLITPSTKGIISGIADIPELDDTNISRQNLLDHHQALNFNNVQDIDRYEHLLRQGFALIETELKKIGQIFVDTKFEFGYVQNSEGNDQLIYMDEVGTPDSSRIWDGEAYSRGEIIEQSKEGFRQALLNYFPDPDILLNSQRMTERKALADNTALPEALLMDVSRTYTQIAEQITGKPLPRSEHPRAEIIEALNQRGLV